MQNSPTHPKKRRWACYARVSTSEQKTGLEAQIRALRTYCEQNGVTDFELFADENQSGSKASRPSLDRMMAAVEAGEIDTCVVFSFSRYARSVSHMLKGLEVMKMLREIGGVPARITSDNPKCFSLEASRYEPLLNPAFDREIKLLEMPASTRREGRL